MKEQFRPSMIPLVTALFFLTACSAHSPFILNETIDSAAPDTTAPASTDKVFITKQPLPPGVAFETVSTIDVGTLFYGSVDRVFVLMANRARELHANAVVEVKTWRQPSGYSYAAPDGSGIAVRVADIKAMESSGIQGSWY